MVKVTSGWRGVKEVNRVIYDSQLTTIDQLEDKLKQAGTFIRRVPPPDM